MHRFFSHNPLLPELRLTTGDQFHQISHVFRAKKGDCLIFFEAGGEDIIYEVTQISKKDIILKQKDVIKKTTQSQKNKKIKVFQAYPNKMQTMELIIQKMVELGIDEIVFFVSQHSQLKGVPVSKHTRLSSIALEALEQSCWNKPLKITHDSRNLKLLWTQDTCYNIVWFIGGEGGIEIPSWNESWGFWVWPEWGWSEQEKDFFVRNEAKLWSFSHNTLRLETATIVGAGILKYLSQIQE